MIKNVLIVGLGGVGAVYASKIPNVNILVDDKRLEYYRSNPTIINDKKYNFNYMISSNAYPMDLIIISVKFYNLSQVLDDLEGFVDKNTKIISLLNGISSEEIIRDKYADATVIPSYLICNSIMRKDRNIIHDDVNKIVMAKDSELQEFFEANKINYEIANDIKSSMWQKFMLNIIANQLSAVTRKTFGEMNDLPYIEDLLWKILEEVIKIAKYEGVNNPEILAKNAINTFKTMAPYGKTSMLQDIENGKPTEIDAFAGTIIQLGQKYNVPTPYNNLFNYLVS